jgi:hypothetical protein
MFTHRSILAFSLFLFSAGLIRAQKNILISDSLKANAEMLKVKMGNKGPFKIFKMSFGDYAVVSSKMGWTTGYTAGNLFNTRTESKSTEKFSFVMVNKTNDSARVNAAKNILTKELHSIEILPGFYWGEDELLNESRNFSAFISINSDTIETWALFINVALVHDKEGRYEAFLTNGTRRIFIAPVSSSEKKSSSPFAMDAAGYELIENKESLGAVQYKGAGAAGLNHNIIWIKNNLEPRMQLFLAAAMTAILQIKTSELLNLDSD